MLRHNVGEQSFRFYPVAIGWTIPSTESEPMGRKVDMARIVCEEDIDQSRETAREMIGECTSATSYGTFVPFSSHRTDGDPPGVSFNLLH